MLPLGDSKPMSVPRLPMGTVSEGSSSGLTLVSHLAIPHVADEMVSDVWKLGSTVMLGFRCGGDGSAIVDVADPSRPRIVARTPALSNLFVDDVEAVHLDGPSWSGDLFIEPFDNCGGSSAPAKTRFWDISDPTHPELLSELTTYSGVHNAYPIVRPDGAFLLMALPRGDTASLGVKGGFAIAEITDPRHPRVVGIYNLRADIGDPPGTDFLHDMWPDATGTTVYAAWWDAGLVRLDITDPSHPTLIGRTVYYGQQEWYGPAAGNLHAALPSPDGRYVYLTDEDFSLGRARIAEGKPDPMDPPPHPALADERGPAQSRDVWGFTRIVDLQAPGGPQLISAMTTTNTARFPPVDSGLYSVHNPFEWEGRLFLSHYSDGVRMWDVTNPAEPRETGYFVPPDLPDRRGRPMKTQVWGVVVEDGLVYASDMAHGLWILSVDDTIPSPTAAPTATASPTPSVTPEPTSTDFPPTEPPTPTDSPIPTDPPTPTDVPAPTDLPTPTDGPPPTEPPTSTATMEPTSTVATPAPSDSPPDTALPPPSGGPGEPPFRVVSTIHLPILLTLALNRSAAAVSRTLDINPRQVADLEVRAGEDVALAGTQAFDEVVVRSGGVLRVEAYEGPGTAGGTLELSARRITVESGGRLSADGAGFRGRLEADGEGPGGGAGGNAELQGLRGDASSDAPHSDSLGPPTHFTGAAAGGGYGGRAGDGMYDKPRGQWPGGRAYGQTDGVDAPWGSAGGAPPHSHHEFESIPGGNGGGALIVRASAVNIEGVVSSDGEDGRSGEYDSAGGGSGGTILIEADSISITGRVSASGGLGGRGWEIGGAGGGGRVKVYFRRGVVDEPSIHADPGQGPCPGDDASPWACPGTVYVERRPDPSFALLPFTLARGCGGHQRLAVAVVIDASRSMDRSGPGATSPLARALVAADDFIGRLAPFDHAGVVAFAGRAMPLAPLTDTGSAREALREVVAGEGSRLDLGIAAGDAVLSVERPPGEERLLVLFSDGVASGESPGELEAAVDHARRGGITVAAIGYGNPPHEPSLEFVAGSADRVWIEPSPGEMGRVISTLRSAVPCGAQLHDAR